MKNGKIAVYPGTFDPVTYGHIDIIKRASRIFDKVIVAVARDPEKEILFTADERVAMLEDSIAGMKNVTVDSFSGLVVDYVKKAGANVVVRGLRMLSDFEYEFQMALTNRKLAEDVETIFMMTHESYSYISSKLIKEAVGLGADLGCFLPKKAEALLRKRLKERRGSERSEPRR